MRAAIYARVSTERQERQQTIDSQLDLLRGISTAEIAVLIDAAATAASFRGLGDDVGRGGLFRYPRKSAAGKRCARGGDAGRDRLMARRPRHRARF